MADTLPCADGAGSINNPENPGTTTPPYVVVEPCVGTWELSGHNDVCAQTEEQIQSGYAAEIININGAPLNIFKLLGVHEQGDGDITTQGTLFASQAAPGYPASGINAGGMWRSFTTGNAIAGNAYLGIDFGINVIEGTQNSEYLPIKPNWKKIGAVYLTQADTATNFVRQIRLETTDGSVEVLAPVVTGSSANGQVTITAGPRSEEGTVSLSFVSATAFNIVYSHLATTAVVGVGTVGEIIDTPYVSVLVQQGSNPWTGSELVSTRIQYLWKRQGVYNLIQSGSPVALNLNHEVLAKAVRVIPTLGTAGTDSWHVSALRVNDSPATNINNIQDLFFQENRDRDYDKVPLRIKAQYSISNSISDLSKYGLNILDQYSFVVSFPTMVALLGRPLVTGDIIEVVPEMQYDQNLKPVRKFLEVTDTGWAAEGYTPTWKPTLYRFNAQQALPSQETRDIFGTIDTQRHLVADNFFAELGVGSQIDITPLKGTEEIASASKKAVPEFGDDVKQSISGVPLPVAQSPINPKGNPPAAPAGNGKLSHMVEDGLPPDNQPYGEGYELPQLPGPADGDWFRLYYPESTKLPARLYRYSIVKNRWIYMETDRRMEQSSMKPSVQRILASNSKQGLGKKNV